MFVISISIFGSLRNQDKKKFKKSIFYSNNKIFLNDSIVNKLLTQILDDSYLNTKDSLDLNIIETELNKNPLIKRKRAFIYFD